MAISGGPRRLRPRGARGACGTRRGGAHISAQAARRLGAGAPRGPGRRARGAAAALPRAQAANFGGVRAAPSPPARRARPFIESLRRRPRPARAPPPPGRPSRSERPRAGLRPGAFVSPARSGAAPPALRARKAGRPARSAPPRRVWLGAPAALGLRCPCLRTVSPLRARVPSAGSAGDRPAPTLAAGAERSAHTGVAGLRQDQLSESSRFPACVLSPDSNCVSFTKQQLWAPGKRRKIRGRKRAGRHRLQRPPPPPHLSPLKTTSTTTKPLRRRRSKCRFPQRPKPFRGSRSPAPPQPPGPHSTDSSSSVTLYGLGEAL
ncbi:WAS/WASL-interacting protein family member 1-like [Lutra lutra]|uniref:WAS/WASL-interacting protein family member 1-like n=1 Tax=Lutra lutra TaxID=9657 RepID=UPI001FD47BD7|nr:WAS/WASL-interacting protein family member 1-like [Lutra lutra]